MDLERRERLRVSASAAVFIEDDQGKLLLLQQASPHKGYKWGPPAGGLEVNESPIGNAQREVEEEIGVKVTLLDLVGVYTVYRENGSGIGFVFRGKINEQIKIKADEIMNFGYFTKEEVLSMLKDNLIYKPEYNEQCVKDWINGDSFPLEVVKNKI